MSLLDGHLELSEPFTICENPAQGAAPASAKRADASESLSGG